MSIKKTMSHAELGNNSDNSVSKICSAMLDMLEIKPFKEIKIGDILEQAGCCRTTMYKYFSNKGEIIDYLVHNEALAYAEILRVSYLSIQDEKSAQGRHDKWPAELFYEHAYKNRRVYNIIIDDINFPGKRSYFSKTVLNLAKKNVVYNEHSSGIPEEMMDFWRYAGTMLYLTSIEWWAANDYKYSASYLSYLFRSYINPNSFFYPQTISENQISDSNEKTKLVK